MSSCRQLPARLRQLLQLTLSPEEEQQLREHVAHCSVCWQKLWEAEPALALAWALPRREVEDETFVGEVLSALKVRAVEKTARTSPSRWLAVAAFGFLALVGSFSLWRTLPRGNPGGELRAMGQVQGSLVPFVEVEGEGVRVYHLVGGEETPVQIALVVDPRLEL